MEFQGKTIVITGGATGIGFALARKMGAGGARIILFEPREDRLEQAVAELSDAGIEAKFVVGDVTAEALNGIGSTLEPQRTTSSATEAQSLGRSALANATAEDDFFLFHKVTFAIARMAHVRVDGGY